MLLLDDGLTNYTYVEKSAIHSVGSAISGEVIGLALDCYDPTARIREAALLDKDSRVGFPVRLSSPRRTGKSEAIGHAIFDVFKLLCVTRPDTDEAQSLVFHKQLTGLIQVYVEDKQGAKFMLGSAIALGAYAALTCGVVAVEFERLGIYLFRTITKAMLVSGTRNMSAYITLAYLFSRLIREGYYCREMATQAIDANMCFGKLATCMLRLDDLWGEKEYMYAFADRQDGLTYLEYILLRSCAAMLHIDYESKIHPKSQIGWITSGVGIDCADALAVYCALASASEYSYSPMFTSAVLEKYENVNVICSLIQRLAE